MGLVGMVIVALAAAATGAEALDAVDPVGQVTATSRSSSKSAQASPASEVRSVASSAGTEEDLGYAVLPCEPVAAYWTGPPQSDGMPQGPSLAIVSIDARPKDARVHLDGRFVGRARYLDGKPGYLYVEPGTYRLELRFEGYQTLVIPFEASVGCKYSIKHYMVRIDGAKKEKKKETFGKGMPFERVFGPLNEPEVQPASTASAGPDLSLRQDLDPSVQGGKTAAKKAGASLRLNVSPESATVSLDGVFVATAWELSLMEGPLATTVGPHVIEVRAEGYVDATKKVDLEEGEELELQISLSEKTTN